MHIYILFLTKSAVLCYNTYRKCGRPLPGVRRPGPPVGGRPCSAHLPRSRAFQARASWKLEAGTLWRAGSWHLNEGAAGSWSCDGAAGKFRELRAERTRVQLDGRCSWELVAGRLKGRRSWSYGRNGAGAVLQTRQLKAARGELNRRCSWSSWFRAKRRRSEERVSCTCG